jgi:hypothetical protein
VSVICLYMTVYYMGLLHTARLPLRLTKELAAAAAAIIVIVIVEDMEEVITHTSQTLLIQVKKGIL